MAEVPATLRAALAVDEFHAFAELLRRSGRVIESRIAGVSMEPTLPHGALVQIQSGDPDSARPGQIVACVLQDSLCTHRVVHVGVSGPGKDYIITQGDGWVLCDPPLPKSAILGVVTHFQKGADRVVPEASAARGFLASVAARTSVWFIRGLLSLHPGFARRTAGMLLYIGTRVRQLLIRIGFWKAALPGVRRP